MTVVLYILLTPVALLFLSCALSPLYFKFGLFKFFYHDLMGWHTPDENAEETFDGASIHSKCKYCGRDIMMDSQGNWF